MAFVHFSWRERNPTKRNKTRAVLMHRPQRITILQISRKILSVFFNTHAQNSKPSVQFISPRTYLSTPDSATSLSLSQFIRLFCRKFFIA